jgi:hypothetical protein
MIEIMGHELIPSNPIEVELNSNRKLLIIRDIYIISV